ncbi:MAG TPA: DNA topoisomerase III [Lachnospiraceae bacterium]|nr:DNA topoisomerase III [Lachnospiraceae bacterium]
MSIYVTYGASYILRYYYTEHCATLYLLRYMNKGENDEGKLVTYPRTDSCYLTDDMGDTAADLIKAVRSTFSFIPGVIEEPDIGRVLNSKKVSDHHAIIPTAEITKADLNSLDDGEKKILYMTAARLLEAVSGPYRYLSQRVVFECAGAEFTAKGSSTIDPGWKMFEDTLRSIYKTEKEEDTEDETSLPDIREGEVFEKVDGKVTEHFTKPPFRYTESSLLSAMEKAGTEDMDSDVERKGLGTPATRADIIEKLVKDGFVKREKKNLIPTDNGIRLITILPDNIKSAKLTAEWENTLSQIAKGEAVYDDFISGITGMVQELVRTYHSVSDEDRNLFSRGDVLGRCPNCGGDVVKGIYGFYCRNKCSMNLKSAMGIVLSEAQLKNLLDGKRILVKGIKKKKGDGTFNAYLTPDGIVDYCYKKQDGTEASGKQFKFKMDFQKNK